MQIAAAPLPFVNFDGASKYPRAACKTSVYVATRQQTLMWVKAKLAGQMQR
jgi:hypothetical protein